MRFWYARIVAKFFANLIVFLVAILLIFWKCFDNIEQRHHQREYKRRFVWVNSAVPEYQLIGITLYCIRPSILLDVSNSISIPENKTMFWTEKHSFTLELYTYI